MHVDVCYAHGASELVASSWTYPTRRDGTVGEREGGEKGQVLSIFEQIDVLEMVIF